MTRKARADAVGNRERLVATARQAFAADGVDLPMREVAGRAGLAVATLYRHFPTRTDLIGAALAEHVAACREGMRTAESEPDAWLALSGAIRWFAEHQIRAPGLNAALFGPHATGFRDDRLAQSAALERLVARAQRDQVLRPGVSAVDVRVALLAISSLRPAQASATRQVLDLLLAGLRGPGVGGMPGPARYN
ncbi:TetR/AcrR family transcriptional regulator [Amycolatopsis sp. NBC_01480]|uniref:TetR/AcrR family transcriptional regulator n=1 Tax=Amycolatopsis sp. NBC_01480 TaxID=2903562 RepID=UPI002E2DCC32|nr:helix-turn-helix domain-containing protein [Amycolatopsis sp. NBC_01480]